MCLKCHLKIPEICREPEIMKREKKNKCLQSVLYLQDFKTQAFTGGFKVIGSTAAHELHGDPVQAKPASRIQKATSRIWVSKNSLLLSMRTS